MDENKRLYQHFSQQDAAFVDQALEMLGRVEERYSLEVSSFINPHQAQILVSLANKQGLKSFVSSDYFPSELVKVLVAPSYYELDLTDFDISLLEIIYANKFQQLTHSQILGTLINQLGIERRVFGDILVNQGRAQIFVDRKFSQFFIDQVQKIAKTSVRLKEVDLKNQLVLVRKSVTRDILVSSLRLDKLLASSFKLSRKLASQLIAAKEVKHNYVVATNPSLLVGLDDLVSVRRYGRFKVIKENGFSKSGKHKLTVEILSSK
ncbi:YlmH family RNA-binding protein [Streptococcus oricebi]|uniref:RNA-binding protein n=1 Tax=Streptococcus oricebi TaxID=1547447 RepID=A0ABS5B1T0_9STRE|nr:YlmH/Sll1252 family protein [Streptococcus oricebi]MBP2622715.1 RNA-binding protein [Streptococcus oricebi]